MSDWWPHVNKGTETVEASVTLSDLPMGLFSNILTTLFARVAVLICALVTSIPLARILGPETSTQHK